MVGSFSLKDIFYYIFLLVLTTFILINLKISFGYIIHRQVVFDGGTSFPGEDFLPLRPYLINVPIAGYGTDYVSQKDPDIDRNFAYVYQRAQFAMAPTILDHYNPWKYEYVIMNLSPQYQALNVLDPNLKVVAHTNHIWLLKRTKK